MTEGGSDDEDEQKFDIDDLSSNESTNDSRSTTSKSSPVSQDHNLSGLPVDVAREKAQEVVADERKERRQAEAAARALAHGTPALRKQLRSRSRSSGLRSGVETPDRFAGPHPHPPKLSPRHVQFSSQEPSASTSPTLPPPMIDRDMTVRGERGTRDDIHSPRAHAGARSRIPRDRDIDAETLKTPTASERRRKSKERATQVSFDGDAHQRRAFAVWGHDESDSAASDSDC